MSDITTMATIELAIISPCFESVFLSFGHLGEGGVPFSGGHLPVKPAYANKPLTIARSRLLAGGVATRAEPVMVVE